MYKNFTQIHTMNFTICTKIAILFDILVSVVKNDTNSDIFGQKMKIQTTV